MDTSGFYIGNVDYLFFFNYFFLKLINACGNTGADEVPICEGDELPFVSRGNRAQPGKRPGGGAGDSRCRGTRANRGGCVRGVLRG